ncbi:MAG: hypothetical protein NTZ74_10125 [Chloroflexi bacterium]|nr:hypothetical protein [Chloroflexota bacterium]
MDELTRLRRQFLQKDSLAQLSLHIQEVAINNQSSQEEKIRLFRSLFKGREDVFPAGLKIPKLEGQSTLLFAGMNGQPGSAKNRRSPVRNAIFAHLFK